MNNMFCIIKIKDEDIYLRKISSKYYVREYFDGDMNSIIEYMVDIEFVNRYITHCISRYTYYTHMKEYSLEKLEESMVRFTLKYNRDKKNIKSFKVI